MEGKLTKRGKLVGSIVVLLFIAIMIPVAIFASTTERIQNNNYVKFNVVDFEGNFYLALVGNKVETPIEKEIVDNKISPVPLFTAKYFYDETTQQGDYYVYSISENSETQLPKNQNTIGFPSTDNKPINVEFDEQHTTIAYYFVFVNTATNNNLSAENDNRNVLISTITSPSSIFGIDSQWSYSISQTANPNSSSFTLPSQWTSNTKNAGDFAEPIKVPARNNESEPFNYVILKFSMEVDPYSPYSVNENFTITINITSEAVTNPQPNE